MACNPFLEALVAKTTRSDNSSRFGKYTKILYHGGRIMGNGRLFVGKARVTAQLDGDQIFTFSTFFSRVRRARRKEVSSHGTTRRIDT